MQSYDYAYRTGVEEIGWERFAELSRTLAEELAGAKVEVVVGIARAGLFPATARVVPSARVPYRAKNGERR